MQKSYVSNSYEETFEIAKNIAKEAMPGGIYMLNGDLGTGKTVFAQGFAKGLGIEDYVNSPTFTIMKSYMTGRLPLYHFDVYRIGSPEEMYDLDYEEYIFGDGVCLIEWAEMIEELLPEDAVRITIEKDMEQDFDYRMITISGGKAE
ncbi:MAG: tRNA (adenosine(37)-N6)-threonylcarbamoyltransferase complex ATPase subunit type 1 TsaE [Lachnospiraceae bacterium]|nr:tRNA (adenosine(37)-N6)-threonylcarbamoyltransferase complex ATPase subunit type 1 TsaE [Lachnospiraceae bacterium]